MNSFNTWYLITIYQVELENIIVATINILKPFLFSSLFQQRIKSTKCVTNFAENWLH